MGGNAIAAAASQAIAATQQLSGRRSSSLKASYEAINLGVQANEFSIGRELAGAAQAAIASTSFETQVRDHTYITFKQTDKVGGFKISKPKPMSPILAGAAQSAIASTSFETQVDRPYTMSSKIGNFLPPTKTT